MKIPTLKDKEVTLKKDLLSSDSLFKEKPTSYELKDILGWMAVEEPDFSYGSTPSSDN